MTRTVHKTTNEELAHYMKIAGVRVVDTEKKWRTTWPEVIRERVARYCVTKYMITKGRLAANELPPRPQVIR